MAEVNELDAACIGVLRDYSMLESRLAWALAALLGVSSDDGSRVLNIVRNNWTRHKLVSEFLRVKKPEFLPFWQQMKKALHGVDEGRNKVAHWYAVADHGVLDGGITPPSPIVHKLVPPGEIFVGDEVALQARQFEGSSKTRDMRRAFSRTSGWSSNGSLRTPTPSLIYCEVYF